MTRDCKRKMREISFCSLDLDIYSIIQCLQYILFQLRKDRKAVCDRGQVRLRVLRSRLALRLSIYKRLHLDIRNSLKLSFSTNLTKFRA